jgi:hypothetical protein
MNHRWGHNISLREDAPILCIQVQITGWMSPSEVGPSEPKVDQLNSERRYNSRDQRIKKSFKNPALLLYIQLFKIERSSQSLDLNQFVDHLVSP